MTWCSGYKCCYASTMIRIEAYDDGTTKVDFVMHFTSRDGTTSAIARVCIVSAAVPHTYYTDLLCDYDVL